MKKSKSITFPYLANSAPTSVWPIYLSLRPLHSEGIVSPWKTEKNPMCIAHLQMETDCVAGFGGWVGWKLCVNNWWKAWPLCDLGQTNPRLKSSPLTWIPVWGKGPKKGDEDKIMFWTYKLVFWNVPVYLPIGGHSVQRGVTQRTTNLFVSVKGKRWSGNNLFFFLSFIQATHRVFSPHNAIWSGSWFRVEWMGWAPLMKTFDNVENKSPGKEEMARLPLFVPTLCFYRGSHRNK